MEGANNNTNSFGFEKEYKMEIETNMDSNHSDMVKKYILGRRTMFSNPIKNDIFSKTKNNNNTNVSFSIDVNDDNFDVIKKMNEVITLLNNLSSKQYMHKFNLYKDNSEKTEKELLENLKKIRKELSKENIPVTKIVNILNNNVQNFIEELLKSFNYIDDDNTHLEILWIVNNLLFFISKNVNVFLDAEKIAKLLYNYLIKIQNGISSKFFLIDKTYRILGNLININNSIIGYLVNNKFVDSIISHLITPVSSFRITCLWLLNKTLLALKRNNASNYIQVFINKTAISNYIFVFSRIKKFIILDEITEFFWLISELAKDYSLILIPIFFSNISDINNITNFDNIKNDYIFNNFNFILNNSLTNKMSQVSLRIIADILVVINNVIKNEYLLNKLIEYFFESKSIILFINDVLNSPKNKYDISLVRDALFLIFNLICLSPIKSSIFFKKGIVNLISDRDYQVNKEVMKLLYIIFYRILRSASLSFEPNDEKVIRSCLSNFKRFKEDEEVLIIFIDILYFYLKASKTNIDNETENELILFSSEPNLSIENYNYMFLKLANIIKMFSPVSKYMRNI